MNSNQLYRLIIVHYQASHHNKGGILKTFRFSKQKLRSIAEKYAEPKPDEVQQRDFEIRTYYSNGAKEKEYVISINFIDWQTKNGTEVGTKVSTIPSFSHLEMVRTVAKHLGVEDFHRGRIRKISEEEFELEVWKHKTKSTTKQLFTWAVYFALFSLLILFLWWIW